MRSLPVVALLVLAGTSTARGDAVAPAAPSTEAHGTSSTELAIAVNPPVRWRDGDALAMSMYVGLDGHHALRANVSRYDSIGNLAGDIVAIAAGGDGDEAIHRGHVTDVGIGWIYFPRRLWSGLSLECGLLGRARDIAVEDGFSIPELVETRSRTLAVRGLIGWSWLAYRRVFVSLAIGLSVGYESGTETTAPLAYMPTKTTHDIGRSDVAGEAFMRIGVAFGN